MVALDAFGRNRGAHRQRLLAEYVFALLAEAAVPHTARRFATEPRKAYTATIQRVFGAGI